MADTLPPDVLAKLERSAQAVGGVNRREGEPAREASAPRAELIPLSDRTPSDLTPVIAPGWSVLTRADRAPVVYDHTPAHPDPETGEVAPLTFHCAAQPTGDGSRGRGVERMDVAAADVTSALPPDARYIGDVLACAYRELGRGTTSRNSASGPRRAWLSGVVAVLEGVRREMGWA